MYASVGLAVSNEGQTFTKVGQILTGSLPKQETGSSAQGIGDVSVCPDHTNTYLYAYYTDWTRVGKRPVQIGLARCKIADEGKPGSWYKYARGGFTEPGLGGKDTPVFKGPTAFPCDAWAPHVTYFKTLKKYVIFFNVTAYSDQQQPRASQSGVYFACSDDGIEWSESELVFAMHCIPYNDREIVMHPGLYVQRETDKKVTGKLIYSYSPRFGTAPPRVPHHMAWRPVSISNLGDSEQKRGTPEEESPVPKNKPSVRGPSLVGAYRLVLTNEKTERRDPVRRLEIKADNTFTTDIGIQGKWRATGSRITLSWGTGDAELEVKNGDLSGKLTKEASGNRFRVTATKTGQ
jgi:hypothetical protein